MKIKSALLCVCFVFICVGIIQANKDEHISIYPTDNVNDKDTVQYTYQRGKDGLIIMPPVEWEPFSDRVSFRDTVIYDPIYLPVVFDGKILPSNLDFLSKDTVSAGYKLHLIPESETLAPLIAKTRDIQARRRNYYTDMNNISNVRYSAFDLKKIEKLDNEDVTKRNKLFELITAENPIEITPLEMQVIAPELRYWRKSGEHSLQLSQNYISENWSGGGNTSVYMNNSHKLTLNYAKGRIAFNNLLEWNLALQRVNGAEKHGTNFTQDLLRLENNFMVKAIEKWSYSSTLQTRTPLFKSYPVNGEAPNTAPFSPLVVNLSLGMNYTLEKDFPSDKTKKFKISQNISPFSINYVYINDLKITKREGVEDGDYFKFEIGSSIKTDIKFTLNRYMVWESYFNYFTNYNRALLEFNNKFEMILSRFLSTNINIKTRFDDSDTAVRDDKLGFWQINEMVTFGLRYKW